MTDTDSIHCPHCQQALPPAFKAELRQRSVVHFRITPAAGELMDARTVGGTLAEMRDLLRAFGRAAGVPTEVLVQGATFDGGAVDFELLIVRFDEAVARRRRRKKAHD